MNTFKMCGKPTCGKHTLSGEHQGMRDGCLYERVSEAGVRGAQSTGVKVQGALGPWGAGPRGGYFWEFRGASHGPSGALLRGTASFNSKCLMIIRVGIVDKT